MLFTKKHNRISLGKRIKLSALEPENFVLKLFYSIY